jgi:hypothetical protein
MNENNSLLFEEMVNWVHRTLELRSAVLFGSSVAPKLTRKCPDISVDIDLHIITSNISALTNIEWKSALPNEKFCFQALRPATGGVRKLTVIFNSGQLDLVLVPVASMRVAAFALRFGLYRNVKLFRDALNEMATCLHAGFRFLKGSETWQRFYSAVSMLPGVRLTNGEMRNLADIAICDALWILQKIESGELIAAQHILHTRVADANLRLWRELRLRHNLPLPSFGLGRRLEIIADEAEQLKFCLSARMIASELYDAVWRSLRTLNDLMVRVESTWRIPPLMQSRLERHRR